MLSAGTDPESYITEFNLVHEGYNTLSANTPIATQEIQYKSSNWNHCRAQSCFMCTAQPFQQVHLSAAPQVMSPSPRTRWLNNRREVLCLNHQRDAFDQRAHVRARTVSHSLVRSPSFCLTCRQYRGRAWQFPAKRLR